jgi:hypothetical protein
MEQTLLLATMTGLAALSAVALMRQAIMPEPVHVLGLTIDRVSVLLTLLVATVGAVYLRFAVRSMDGEPGHKRFLRWLSFSVAMAFLLMLSTNLIVLFLTWSRTGMGLYRLLSHDTDRPDAIPTARVDIVAGIVRNRGLRQVCGRPGLLCGHEGRPRQPCPPAGLGGGADQPCRRQRATGPVAGSDRRTGLAARSAFNPDGSCFHAPMRLQVFIEAKRERIDQVRAAHPGVRDLADNGWVRLFALSPTGNRAWRRLADGVWEGAAPAPAATEAKAAA